MVQKYIENFNEYRTVYSGTAMPVGDKQQPVAAKKVALRELSQNTFMEPPENSSVPKEKGSALDVAKTYNVKRQKPSLCSPRSLPPGCTGPNGHIVYVRRKLNKEAKKIVTVDKVNSAEPPSPKHIIGDGSKALKMQKDLIEETKVSPSVSAPVSRNPVNTSSREPSLVPSLEKPTKSTLPEPNHSDGTNAEKPTPTREPSSILSFVKPTETVLPEPNHSEGINAIADQPASTGEPSIVLSLRMPTKTVLTKPSRSEVLNAIANQSNPPRPGGQHWKERFQKLQTFLQKCNQSNQEEYIQKLQSLSAVGRSRHAVELERRAIRLLMEEAKELKRMNVLNVLGKTSAMTQAPISTETHSPDQNLRGK